MIVQLKTFSTQFLKDIVNHVGVVQIDVFRGESPSCVVKSVPIFKYNPAHKI